MTASVELRLSGISVQSCSVTVRVDRQLRDNSFFARWCVFLKDGLSLIVKYSGPASCLV